MNDVGRVKLEHDDTWGEMRQGSGPHGTDSQCGTKLIAGNHAFSLCRSAMVFLQSPARTLANY